MPHHPSEENTSSHVFDQVAKESSDSTASDHHIHQTGDKQKASTQDHQSKGPQIPENLPSATGTKEELKAKAQELNK